MVPLTKSKLSRTYTVPPQPDASVHHQSGSQACAQRLSEGHLWGGGGQTCTYMYIPRNMYIHVHTFEHCTMYTCTCIHTCIYTYIPQNTMTVHTCICMHVHEHTSEYLKTCMYIPQNTIIMIIHVCTYLRTLIVHTSETLHVVYGHLEDGELVQSARHCSTGWDHLSQLVHVAVHPLSAPLLHLTVLGTPAHTHTHTHTHRNMKLHVASRGSLAGRALCLECRVSWV